MSRALVTLATGPHEPLLQIAMPSFREFATRHRYDLLDLSGEVKSDRPPSWWKIPALRAVLDEYDEALWLDADVVIVDDREDLPVPAEFAQAVVAHRTGDGEVPNLGVWFLRREMRPILDKMWAMVEFVGHVWWEQAAMCKLLGYAGFPLAAVEPTVLLERTFFLDNSWNRHRNDRVAPAAERFMHATMWPDRAAVMRQWAALADEVVAA